MVPQREYLARGQPPGIGLAKECPQQSTDITACAKLYRDKQARSPQPLPKANLALRTFWGLYYEDYEESVTSESGYKGDRGEVHVGSLGS